MNCIPQVKNKITGNGFLMVENVYWSFAPMTDKRIIAAAERICKSDTKGVPVNISHGNALDEGYELIIGETCIDISSEGCAGAFYALQTLKMLLVSTKGKLEICTITDCPDMKIRGFYHDTTRGRVPTLDTLKKLADTMADYKMNMLQLYVEHSFDFEEYDFCKEELGYLTADEIKELDSYCKERFIELVPSLSCFGHLYHLLQSDKYKHLCELQDYKPEHHLFHERMIHHTINPLLPESFELITSLIDTHMSAFTSEYFNICCDETFDLGMGANKGADKAELYIGFVTKLIKYVESKGKKVMMWGDIVLQYPESTKKLPDSIIYLNWDYAKSPKEDNIKALSSKRQALCPGTWSWIGFSERIGLSKSNILSMAEFGHKYNALGLMNTNWGDMGHLASVDMAMYSMILGAAASWNKETKADSSYDAFVAQYHYGNADAVKILEFFDETETISNWTNLMVNKFEDGNTKELYEEQMSHCKAVIKNIEESSFISEHMKNIFSVTARGHGLLMQWCAARQGFEPPASGVDFKKWLEDYEQCFMAESKPSEFDKLKELFIKFNS